MTMVNPTDMSPLLGIYIATYNRAAELRDCLDAFIRQVRKYNFPIFISDASTDQRTRELIEELRKDYPNVFYMHIKHTDYMHDAVNVIRFGDSEFLWFFGDDDIVEDGAVDLIARELKNGYSFLQINNQQYSKDMSFKVGKAAIDARTDREEDNNEALSNAANGYAGFMAGIITRKEWLDAEISRSFVKNRDFIPNMFVWRAIIGKRGKLIAAPLIRYRTGGSLGGREIEVWFKSFEEGLDMLRPEYQESAIKAARRRDLYKQVYIAKRDHPEMRRVNKRIIRESQLGFVQKVLCLLILNMPVKPKQRR